MIQIMHRFVTIPIAYSRIVKQMPCYSFRDRKCNSFDRGLQTADINSVHYGKHTSNRFQCRLLSFPEHNVAIKVSIMEMHTECVTTMDNCFHIWIHTLISPRWHGLYLMRFLGLASRARTYTHTHTHTYIHIHT